MSELVQLLTTVADEEQARDMASGAVEARLAACVQIVGPITSVYRWRENVERDREFLLLMKVPAGGLDRLVSFVRARHPYEVPELTAVPSGFVDERYLAWAREVTSQDSH